MVSAGRITVGSNRRPGLLRALLLVSIVGTTAAVVPSEVHMRALTNSTSCGSELDDCSGDASCADCFDEYEASVGGCEETLGSPMSCDEFNDILCCGIAGDTTCNNNFALNEYLDCLLVEAGCPIDLTACSSTAGGVTADDDALTTTTTPPTTTTPTIDGNVTMTDSSTSCPTELEECSSDSICDDCITEYRSSGLEGCVATLGSPTTCDGFVGLLCCGISGINTCAGNVALEDLFGCMFVETDCPIDLGMCEASATVVTDGDDDSLTTDGASSNRDNLDQSSTARHAVTTTTWATLGLLVCMAYYL